MTIKWTEFLRGINGGVEVNRLIGFLGGLGLIAFTGYELIALHRAFDPLAFSAGVAAIVSGTGAGVALKDRNSAHAKVVAETGSRPADPPAPAPQVQPALTGEANDNAGLPEFLQ